MSYRIVDEPTPGPLTHLAVRPLWPLFAQMFAGAWLAWPWFALNAIALGSATRRREHATIFGVVAGSVVIALVVLAMLRASAWGDAAAPYVVVALVALKLGAAYWVHALQERTAALHEHFGGVVRNGAGVVIAGAIVRQIVLGADLPLFWVLVLA